MPMVEDVPLNRAEYARALSVGMGSTFDFTAAPKANSKPTGAATSMPFKVLRLDFVMDFPLLILIPESRLLRETLLPAQLWRGPA
jgi:hypothetical protein